MLEDLIQVILAKEGRLKRYRNKQCKQNWTFQNSARKVFQQVGGEYTRTNGQPDAKETKQFWNKIWEMERTWKTN